MGFRAGSRGCRGAANTSGNLYQTIFCRPGRGARDVVNQLKRVFGKKISVDLLLKNNDNSHRLYQAGVDQIDHYVPEKYSRTDVEKLIKLV